LGLRAGTQVLSSQSPSASTIRLHTREHQRKLNSLHTTHSLAIVLSTLCRSRWNRIRGSLPAGIMHSLLSAFTAITACAYHSLTVHRFHCHHCHHLHSLSQSAERAQRRVARGHWEPDEAVSAEPERRAPRQLHGVFRYVGYLRLCGSSEGRASELSAPPLSSRVRARASLAGGGGRRVG
jgi:hypothetical protein